MGADKSLLMACLEEKKGDGEDRFIWSEKTMTCNKINAASFDYFVPSDTMKETPIFTIEGDG